MTDTQKSPTSRARSPEDRDARRTSILDAAETLLMEAGFEKLSMNALAKACGLAKGTLYLYFRTREEVFLALFLRHLGPWVDRVIADIRPGVPDAEVAASLVRHMAGDRVFMRLYPRLGSVIEQNLSPEVLIASKGEVMGHFMRLANHMHDAMGLSVAQSMDACRSLGAALQGAAQFAEVTAPDGAELPPEVALVFELSEFEPTARTAAELILRGVRAGA